MCFYDYINISKISILYMIPVANEWLICCGSLIAYRLIYIFEGICSERRYSICYKGIYYIYLPSFVKYRPSKVPSYYFTHAFLCVCAWHVQEIQCEKIEILSLLGRPAVSNNERAQPLESKGLTLASFLSQSDGHRRPGSLTLWCLFSLRPYE